MRASSLTSVPTRVSCWRTGCITKNSETAKRNRKTLLPTTTLAKIRREQRPPHSPMFFRSIVKRRWDETDHPNDHPLFLFVERGGSSPWGRTESRREEHKTSSEFAAFNLSHYNGWRRRQLFISTTYFLFHFLYLVCEIMRC